MRNLFLIILLLFITGCVTLPKGPSAVKIYKEDLQRGQIAIIRVQQRTGFKILSCDRMPVYGNTEYILLLPGRHEIWFHIMGQTLLETFWITNKKYVDVRAGHTYLLKTLGGGLVTVGNKWYPDVIDVTNDSILNVPNVPAYAEAEYPRIDTSSIETYDNSKLTVPKMSDGLNK